MITWRDPEDRASATERSRVLKDEISKIDTQLTTRGRVKPDGRPMLEEEYEAWRRSAKHAKAMKMSEYRFLTNWLRTHQGDYSNLDKLTIIVEQLLDSAS